MTRTGQYCAVIGILVACLAVTTFTAVGAPAARRPAARGAAEAATPAPLDAVGPALARLTEAATRYVASADAASREALQRELVRFAEVREGVERSRVALKTREARSLLDAVRALVPRIHVLALEIADVGDPRAERAAADKLALLERLAAKTRTALDQLRHAPAQAAAGTGKIAGLAPAAPESFVPEGLAVLILTLLGTLCMALVPSRHSLGR